MIAEREAATNGVDEQRFATVNIATDYEEDGAVAGGFELVKQQGRGVGGTVINGDGDVAGIVVVLAAVAGDELGGDDGWQKGVQERGGVHVIGGADLAAELDAKRAIAQGAELAARL